MTRCLEIGNLISPRWIAITSACMAGSDRPMCNVSKVWPAPLLAAMTVLALVLANAIGAYAHAAAHALPSAELAEAVAGACDHAGHGHRMPATETAAKPGHIGHSHSHEGGDGTGHAHLDCCDTICHGGQAILAPEALDLPLPHSVPEIGYAAGCDSAGPAGLDRPPKSVRPA
jgi:hypothetical protein